MDVRSIIKQKVCERGITLTFLSKKTGISVKKISSCLNGNRQIKADEFVSICDTLSLKLSNFIDSSSQAT